MNCKIIAFANPVLHVGKSTLSQNVAAALAMQGMKVLLVDLDAAECSLTKSAFSSCAKPWEHPGVAEALSGGSEVDIYSCILPIKIPVNLPGQVYLMPVGQDLGLVERDLSLNPLPLPLRLKQVLKPLRREFHFILLDCPSSFGVLSYFALSAADGVYVPTRADAIGSRALAAMTACIRNVQATNNSKLSFLGIIPAMYDGGFRWMSNLFLMEQCQEYPVAAKMPYAQMPRDGIWGLGAAVWRAPETHSVRRVATELSEMLLYWSLTS